MEDKYSEIFEVDYGIPQGSVLSPALFSLMMNDMFEEVHRDIQYSIYADDVAMWCKHRSQTVSHNILQEGLQGVLKWTQKWGFSLSPLKTVAMIFSRKRINPALSISIDGSLITYKTAHRFLGMIFDNNLTWRTHIKDLKNRCLKIVPLLQYL